MFEKIKRFYDVGIYNEWQVYKFYEKGIITLEEYDTIIGSEK